MNLILCQKVPVDLTRSVNLQKFAGFTHVKTAIVIIDRDGLSMFFGKCESVIRPKASAWMHKM
jgi:hypothetical protein